MRSPSLPSIILIIIAATTMTVAQSVPVSSPVRLDLGIGGGMSFPGTEIQKYTETAGWHAGVKARIASALPFDIVGSVTYNRVRDKAGSPFGSGSPPPEIFGIPTEPGESVFMWMFGAGLECKLPMPIVSPYVAADGLVSTISNTKSGSSSFTREGFGLGGGVGVSLPMLGDIDASVKYQIFNALGRDAGEETLSQVALNLTLMFNLL